MEAAEQCPRSLAIRRRISKDDNDGGDDDKNDPLV